MTKLIDLLNKHKYSFIWTFCYVFFMWAILKWMFNFNIFVLNNWLSLTHVHLHGFPGFVFGILLLSAIPIYIATTSIIIRTKKPLFMPKLPKFMQPVLKEEADNKPLEQAEHIENEPAVTPDEKAKKIIPTELRAAFIRARAHIGPAPKSNFDITNVTEQKIPANKEEKVELHSAGDLPIPTDFEDSSFDSDFTPVFSEINFDDDETGNTDTKEQPNKNNTYDNELNPLTDYLTSQGMQFKIENGLVFTNKDVISVHNDPDFWIADEETWFAAGKQKPSPIQAILTKSAEQNLHPVLYLGQTNILDLDSNCVKWSESGIKVITDLNELK